MTKRKIRKKSLKKKAEVVRPQVLSMEEDALYRQGIVALRAQDWIRARSCFEAVLCGNAHHLGSLENLGATCYLLREFEKAERALREAILIDATRYRAHYNLGMVLKAAGSSGEALSAFKKTLVLNPGHASALQMAAALGGARNHQPKQEFVESLFDQYASKFDEAMKQDLECRVPERLHKLLQEKTSPNAFFEHVLDLGCGTGLSGLPFRRHAKTLIGVDLSEGMLEVAKQKSIYDQLHKQNIHAFLAQSSKKFALVILADVVVYLSQLDTLFRGLHRVLVDGGLVLLSTEETKGNSYALQESGRYAHAQSYVEKICRENGYYISGKTSGPMRYDGGKLIPGCFYLIGKVPVSVSLESTREKEAIQ